jgi:hypothetical protein
MHKKTQDRGLCENLRKILLAANDTNKQARKEYNFGQEEPGWEVDVQSLEACEKLYSRITGSIY